MSQVGRFIKEGFHQDQVGKPLWCFIYSVSAQAIALPFCPISKALPAFNAKHPRILTNGFFKACVFFESDITPSEEGNVRIVVSARTAWVEKKTKTEPVTVL